MNKIRGAIFDLDGTLIDSMTQWQKIEEDYINELGVTLTAEHINHLNTMSVSQMGEYVKKEFNLNISVSEMTNEINSRMIRFYGREVQLKDGILNVLETLKKSGVKMCVATASDRPIVEIVFERLNLDKYFDFIVTCRECGKGKDCPDIFDDALLKLKTQKDDTYIFEDSFVAISTAKKYDYNVIGIYDITSKNNEKKIIPLCDFYTKSENLCGVIDEIL